jgi:tRNA 5-methylaminomethyl-2-thiouridine biosynthesis bifunctional protein
MAAAVARHGCDVTIYERRDDLAAGASGNPIGLVLPPLHQQPNALGDWQLAAYFHARNKLGPQAKPDLAYLGDGKNTSPEQLKRLLIAQQLPAEFIEFSAATTSLPCLVVSPSALCRELAGNLNVRLKTEVSIDALSADVIIDCRGPRTTDVDLRHVRGQLVYLIGRPPQRPFVGKTYLVPTPTGAVLGASFIPDDDSTAYRMEEEARLLADFESEFGRAPLAGLTPDGGRVGTRACTSDYLPLIGPLPDKKAWTTSYLDAIRHGRPHNNLPDPQWHPGRYVLTGLGSHGIGSSLLAAEVLAAHLFQQPCPTPVSLRAAISPSRFLVRRLRQSDPV